MREDEVGLPIEPSMGQWLKDAWRARVRAGGRGEFVYWCEFNGEGVPGRPDGVRLAEEQGTVCPLALNCRDVAAALVEGAGVQDVDLALRSLWAQGAAGLRGKGF